MGSGIREKKGLRPCLGAHTAPITARSGRICLHKECREGEVRGVEEGLENGGLRKARKSVFRGGFGKLHHIN